MWTIPPLVTRNPHNGHDGRVAKLLFTDMTAWLVRGRKPVAWVHAWSLWGGRSGLIAKDRFVCARISSFALYLALHMLKGNEELQKWHFRSIPRYSPWLRSESLRSISTASGQHGCYRLSTRPIHCVNPLVGHDVFDIDPDP